MRTYVEMQFTEKVLSSITCDICGTSYTADDIHEIQEFHRGHFTGGYGSVFGDMTEVECDICQHCLLDMLKGKYRENFKIGAFTETSFEGEI